MWPIEYFVLVKFGAKIVLVDLRYVGKYCFKIKSLCRCYWPIDALQLFIITKFKMFSEMGEDSGDYVIVGNVRQRKAASLHLQVTKET